MTTFQERDISYSTPNAQLVPPGYSFASADQAGPLAGYDSSVLTRIQNQYPVSSSEYFQATRALVNRRNARSATSFFNRTFFGSTLKKAGHSAASYAKQAYNADAKYIKQITAEVVTGALQAGATGLVEQILGRAPTFTRSGALSISNIGIRAVKRAIENLPDQFGSALAIGMFPCLILIIHFLASIRPWTPPLNAMIPIVPLNL